MEVRCQRAVRYHGKLQNICVPIPTFEYKNGQIPGHFFSESNGIWYRIARFVLVKNMTIEKPANRFASHLSISISFLYLLSRIFAEIFVFRFA